MPDLERLAELVRIKNNADAAIADLIGQPSAPGNIGEFVAATVFAVRLMTSGSHPGYDGVCRQLRGGPGVRGAEGPRLQLSESQPAQLALFSSLAARTP